MKIIFILALSLSSFMNAQNVTPQAIGVGEQPPAFLFS